MFDVEAPAAPAPHALIASGLVPVNFAAGVACLRLPEAPPPTSFWLASGDSFPALLFSEELWRLCFSLPPSLFFWAPIDPTGLCFCHHRNDSGGREGRGGKKKKAGCCVAVLDDEAINSAATRSVQLAP